MIIINLFKMAVNGGLGEVDSDWMKLFVYLYI